jgi:hypothetical protein
MEGGRNELWCVREMAMDVKAPPQPSDSDEVRLGAERLRWKGAEMSW